MISHTADALALRDIWARWHMREDGEHARLTEEEWRQIEEILAKGGFFYHLQATKTGFVFEIYSDILAIKTALFSISASLFPGPTTQRELLQQLHKYTHNQANECTLRRRGFRALDEDFDSYSYA